MPLCGVPDGRPSTSRTIERGRDVLTNMAGDWMLDYIVVALVTGHGPKSGALSIGSTYPNASRAPHPRYPPTVGDPRPR